MKYLGVLGFVAFAAAFLFISEAADANWGVVGPRDILLHREIVSMDWKLLRIVSRDVEFYPKNTNRTITAIRVIDFNRSGGGVASLMKGGPGFRNATIHLKSSRSHGLNFAVEIMGL